MILSRNRQLYFIDTENITFIFRVEANLETEAEISSGTTVHIYQTASWKMPYENIFSYGNISVYPPPPKKKER